ncbi:efflux RND transporter permease subunit [Neoehrlichia mikurensis]|uniref:Efflux RND transporter permease subunit n=1 Tax=Neoehrlichia mikurensis TaxID=89586 RepID=A0A9Q9BSQ8_9RICK|nr:efflux RND transporter permease subunit [Neoehrlichia mikurensis]QXK91994.1 efflux RND transporter permease subunit [Neoehrlichia mikurensis]QXK92451.1 efflux RND transporter permease subunit [Neoehrlichia mikurensis]QXK93686.1 efflux RND transporter permease subunit [Neoehrlichia mikurensis]UTO55342.1 efflux RND transporter permease subunit [Neoehrlichia mikurensis]UTO56263.1 efflux RND transporter permease subunit [Neoehrlichia mikurensis]
MKVIAGFFFKKNRFTLFLLASILCLGLYSYINIPREKTPEIKIPILSISTSVQGMSPEDAEKLLILPIEKEVKFIEGIERITSIARDGIVNVMLEFIAGFDHKKAMENVRSKLESIRSRLPKEANFPVIHEIDLSLFPVLSIGLVGDIPERTLMKIAQELQHKIETLSNVLSLKIIGMRKDILEVIISPDTINMYNLHMEEILLAIARNNKFIQSGNLESYVGNYTLNIEGLLKNYQDIMNIPIKVDGNSVVTVKDIATVRPTFESAKSFARVNGNPCLVLEVSKKSGKNTIETIQQVKNLINDVKSFFPKNLSIIYLQDQSHEILDILNELQNTIIISILLVIVVMMICMGVRVAILVSLSIPISFLLGITAMYFMGCTLNVVILFSLIMAVGMLVDDAIVINEYADRKMISGFSKKEAFQKAAYDMFWPVASATLTKLAVFCPLLFWPGVTGEFMKYIPIALITTLTGSWIMAIIFMPVLGSIFGKPSVSSSEDMEKINAIESGDISKLGIFFRYYAYMLNNVLDYPKKFIFIVTAILLMSTITYFTIGPGVKFFPNIEPSMIIINVQTDSNLSIYEKSNIIKEIEEKIANIDDVKFFYSKIGDIGSDELIGKIHIELKDWKFRRKSRKILKDMLYLIKDIKGIIINIEEEKMGPNKGKPIQINLSSYDIKSINSAAAKVTSLMAKSSGFIDIVSDNSSLEMEWRIDIDRYKAAKFGANVSMIGDFLKMITDGVILNKYYPSNSNEEVDIIAKFTKDYRRLGALKTLFINTIYGPVSIENFITKKAFYKVKKIKRIDGLRTLSISSNLEAGYFADERIKYLQSKLKQDWDSKVLINFDGEIKNQKDSENFLLKAFIIVIVLIAAILIIEFNNLYYVFTIMTAIFLSTTCVFFGLLLTYQVFGVVMGGVGIIVLAGVIVNNNILLIDAFCANLNNITVKKEAIIRAALTRIRPILLTVVTGVLGLVPMIFKVSIDFLHRDILYDSPSSQLWVELSITISIGLMLATVITLFFTPSLLMISNIKKRL